MKTSASHIILFVTIIWNSSGSSEAIFNGTEASLGQFPYQVAVVMGTGWHAQVCGGSILNDFWVLTAAHCVYDTKTGQARDSILIKTGLSIENLQPAKNRRGVETIFIHEKYNHTFIENDIAVLKVDRPFEWSEEVRPVQLASSNDQFEGTAVVSGWGHTAFGIFEDLKLLRMTTITVPTLNCSDIHVAQKQTYPSHLQFDTDLTFCSFGVGPCSGDSGSPLVLHGLQFGIVSYGTPCFRKKLTVYTRVAVYIDWIESKIDPYFQVKYVVKRVVVPGLGLLVLLIVGRRLWVWVRKSKFNTELQEKVPTADATEFTFV